VLEPALVYPVESLVVRIMLEVKPTSIFRRQRPIAFLLVKIVLTAA